MEEKQIIAQLKGLRQNKPDQEWMESTKSYILGPVRPHEKVFSGGFLIPFKMPKLQPIMIAPLLIVLLVGVGIFSYSYFNTPEQGGDITETPYETSAAAYLVLAETKLGQIENSEDIKEVSEMLGKAVDSMASMPKDPVETAKMVASLTNINKKEKELADGNTEGVEEIQAKTDVLASKIAEILEENIKDIIAELAELGIKDLETRTLTEEQEEMFKEIKFDYEEGNYEQAWEKILELQN